MRHTTEGIVLRSREYGEADLIVSFLTRDFGLIHTFARSPRKTKSRFGSSLEPLSHVRISFWGREHSALPRLVQADLLRSFQGIRDSYDCFMKVSELLRIALAAFPERDASVNGFGFLLNALGHVEEYCLNPVVLLAVKIKLLKLAGFAPRLKGCARCGAPGDVFHLREGSVLCLSCRPGGEDTRTVTAGVVRLYDSLSRWSLGKVHRIRPVAGLIEELTSLVDSHVKYYITREKRESGAVMMKA